MNSADVGIGVGGSGRSLRRGLDILELLGSTGQELRTREVADQLAIPLASTYRVLRDLELAGFVERRPQSGALRLGYEVVRLASVVLAGSTLRSVSRPVMEGLEAEVGQTVVLLVPGREFVVCVDCIDGRAPIRPRSLKVGECVPYNGGAGALAILAFLAEDRRVEIMDGCLGRMTGDTVVNRDALDKRCKEIVRCGVSRSRGEAIPGTAAVAAPVFSGAPPVVVGSVCVTGLEEGVAGIESPVREAGRAITARL